MTHRIRGCRSGMAAARQRAYHGWPLRAVAEAGRAGTVTGLGAALLRAGFSAASSGS